MNFPFLAAIYVLKKIMDESSKSFCRTLMDGIGIRGAENGLDASNKTGPLSIFA